MGVHVGTPLITEEGYTGIDVHRAARIGAAGHGGQILLSATAAAPSVFAMRDLGSHRLAGLPEPEHIHQLLADGLPRDFPPLRNTIAMLGNAMTVVIAEDSVLLREGVVRLLGEAGFEVAAQSGTADDLLRHVALHRPDVAIVDIRMPPTHTDEGLVAARSIRERFPETGVLVLSQYVEPAYAVGLLEDGADGVGYLLKDRISDLEEFASAVRRVGEGGSALDPEVVSQLLGRRRVDDPLDALTPREREVMELIAEGRSNQAIADRMFVTLRAVEKHVTSIFTKLDLPASTDDHRRVLAVLAFMRD
jgi:DNA-binding NarL/FixJ family response regulator